MSGPSDTAGSERPCGLSSLLPIGMSCRGKAEAFARSLQSRLRTLGTQNSTPLVINDSTEDHSESSWLTQNESQITNIQPLRNLTQEADSFFDFDIENESPGSPADECEYSRLIETASTTPHDAAPESGYVCASPLSPENSLESQSSSDGPYFDPESSDADQRSLTGDYYDCVDASKNSQQTLVNGISPTTANGPISTFSTTVSKKDEQIPNENLNTVVLDSDSCSESLPPSQSTDTCTAHSSASNSTLQDIPVTELEEIMLSSNESQTLIPNGHVKNGAGEETGCCSNSGESLENKLETETKPAEETNGNHNNNNHHHNHNIDDSDHHNEVTTLEIDQKCIVECFKIISATPDTSESEDLAPENNETAESSLKLDISSTVPNETEETDHKEHLSVSTSSAEEDEDESTMRPQRVRRCSSLKTGKTPPGTPGRKKIVRFADVFGLDLADVRTFLDELPKIPKSAFDDLEVSEKIETHIQQTHTISFGPRVDKLLMPLFQQPAGLPKFLDMVREKQVCLENAAVTDPVSLTITGCVRVRNLDFNKSVHIRYSLDQWKSFADLQANYVENSCDGFSDKFSFTVFGNSLMIGQRLEMACRFQCKGQQFWDNNYGQNYVFQCMPAAHTPLPPLSHTTDTDNSWCTSFY